MSKIYQSSKDEYIVYNQEFIQNPEKFIFPNVKNSTESNHGSQRGTASFIELKGCPLVLKHYYRGGLVAKLSNDKYLWTGLTNTRVYKEWQLLEAMSILKLPVPVPFAARIKRYGLFYSSDLITQRILTAVPFGNSLKTTHMEPMIWASIGKLIQTFHRHGVYHADLNANNILITDSYDLYLIDFDKGRLRMKATGWMNEMLKRLERSFHKLKSKNPDYHFTSENWQTLMQGYMS